jgi:transposase
MADLAFASETEVLSAVDAVRRCRWSDADKLRIVGESVIGHRRARATARRHGVSRPLLTAWRRPCRNGESGEVERAFTPVAIKPEYPAPGVEPARCSLEILLANGRRQIS